MNQMELFPYVAAAYAESRGDALSNGDLYEQVAVRAGLSKATLEAKVPIGQAQAMHRPVPRTIRWVQQTLKRMGVIERVADEKGVWRLAEDARAKLKRVETGAKLLAFSTDLGVAIWARAQDIFPHLDEPIALCVTSPPYPLRQPRAYGNPTEAQFVDFLCEVLEPIVRNLAPGGSIVLNIGNDVFLERSPALSMYAERMLLALHDRLGLSLMNRIPWVNLSKPPGPTLWACVKRVQLASAHELVYWLTNDPARVRADNRRVMEAHTARHMELLARGGESRSAVYGDGAYRIRPGSFGQKTPGRLPRNVLIKGHACADTRAYRQYAAQQGLLPHGATQPTSIPDFFVRFLTEPGDLVVDPFGGTARTGLAAERLGRRWIISEWILEYLRGAAGLFQSAAGFSLNPALQHGGR